MDMLSTEQAVCSVQKGGWMILWLSSSVIFYLVISMSETHLFCLLIFFITSPQTYPTKLARSPAWLFLVLFLAQLVKENEEHFSRNLYESGEQFL